VEVLSPPLVLDTLDKLIGLHHMHGEHDLKLLFSKNIPLVEPCAVIKSLLLRTKNTKEQ
jgi:hypothetical protein